MNLIQRTIISTTLARIPLKKWSSPHTQKKNLKCSTWLQYQEQQNDLCSLPRKTIQYHSNPSLRSNHYSQRSWSWMVLWRPTRHSRTNTKERCAFHHRGLECKSRKLRDTWITGKIGLGVQNEAGQSFRVSSREHTDHSKHLPTTQERLYTWTSPDDQYWKQIDYILFSQKWRSSILSA